jgi:hypothetical protein
MCPDGVIRRFAGVFVLISVVLGTWVNPAWFLFTAFVGVNLLQSSFTNFCPLEKILGAAGLMGCTGSKQST